MVGSDDTFLINRAEVLHLSIADGDSELGLIIGSYISCVVLARGHCQLLFQSALRLSTQDVVVFAKGRP